MNPQDTHNLIVGFGKHKGERWTRVPISYLKWILNEMPETAEAHVIAKAELERRGDTMPKGIEISNHAIDKASLRVRKRWHEDRGQDEGLYSWLVRIGGEALESVGGEQVERIKFKGCVLVFTHGNHFPTIKTVMPDKKWQPKRGTR